MHATAVLAAILAVSAAEPASAQPTSNSLADWRRAMACQAHISKLADENERGYRTFVAAARRDRKLRDQVADIERTEQVNVRMKRVFARSARQGADAIFNAGYPQWMAADPNLPPPDVLVRREETAARWSAAKLRNLQERMEAIEGLKCEEILPPSP